MDKNNLTLEKAQYLDIIIGELAALDKTVYYYGIISQLGIPPALKQELLNMLITKDLVKIVAGSGINKIIVITDKGKEFAYTNSFVKLIDQQNRDREMDAIEKQLKQQELIYYKKQNRIIWILLIISIAINLIQLIFNLLKLNLKLF